MGLCVGSERKSCAVFLKAASTLGSIIAIVQLDPVRQGHIPDVHEKIMDVKVPT